MGDETSVGVPIKLMHEAEGHVVTLETENRTVFKGKLNQAEDNMNCQLCDVQVSYRDGRTATMENVFIRGSKIRFLIFPEMLSNAPMFKQMEMIAKSGGPRGRGGFRAGVRGSRGRGGFRGGGGRGGGGRGGMRGGPPRGGPPRGRGRGGPPIY